MRLLLGLCISLMLVTGGFAAPQMAIPPIADKPADKIVMPDDPMPDAPFIRADHQWMPRRDDIIGDVFEAGDTYYDYQSNGSIGKFIGVDLSGIAGEAHPPASCSRSTGVPPRAACVAQ